MILNESAEKLFGYSDADEISAVEEYSVWKKNDPFGRAYYGVSNFCGADTDIAKDCDLSWLEWDGNEINVSSSNPDDAIPLFRKTVGIMKSWQLQLKNKFPNERFVIFASYDDGSELIEGSDPYIGFTLRFWNVREGQGYNGNMDSAQPLLKLLCE